MTTPIIPSNDRAVFLARLLQQRGIPLSAPWADAMPDLSVRLYLLLQRSDLETLGDVLHAMRNEGEETPFGKNTPRHAFDDLWEAFEDLAGPAVTRYDPALAESPEEVFRHDRSEPEWTRQSLSAYTLARMEKAGVNPEQPWQEALPGVSARLRSALGKYGALREVVIAATDGVQSFRRTRDLGRKTLRELWVLLETLSEHGVIYLRYGNEGASPATIYELVARAMQPLSEEDARLLTLRFLEGATLEHLGREQGVSRNAIRLRINRILRTMRARSHTAARELTAPLIEAMERSGGLIHRELAQTLTATADLRRICLAAQFANVDLRIWHEEFLTTLKPGEIATRLSAIRARLRKNRNSAIPLTDVSDLIAASSGFRLESEGLIGLLTNYLNCQVTEDNMVFFGIPRK